MIAACLWRSKPVTAIFLGQCGKTSTKTSQRLVKAVRRMKARVDFGSGCNLSSLSNGNDDNEYLPRLYKTNNCVVYTGSHDSDCTVSWLKKLDVYSKARLNKECKRNISQSRTYDLIELALSSDANLAVIPLQDYMCLNNEQGRINTPSKADGNWNYRLSPRYNTPTLRDKIKRLTDNTKRTK